MTYIIILLFIGMTCPTQSEQLSLIYFTINKSKKVSNTSFLSTFSILFCFIFIYYIIKKNLLCVMYLAN